MWWKKRANRSWSAAFASSKFRTGPSEKNTLRSDPARLIVASIPFASKACARPAWRSSAVASSAGVRILAVDQVERGQAGRHRDRVPAERPGLVDGPDRRELLHQVAPAAERGAREAAAHHLAEDGEVGRDAVALLRPAAGDPEPGDHLVEDQERAVLVAEETEPFEVARRRAARRPCSRGPARR